MFNRFFKKEDSGKGPPSNRLSTNNENAQAGGGGFFNLPPPGAGHHNGQQLQSSLPPTQNTLGSTYTTTGPPMHNGNNGLNGSSLTLQSGNDISSSTDMFGGMSIKNPSSSSSGFPPSSTTSSQSSSSTRFNEEQHTYAPSGTTSSLFSGLELAPAPEHTTITGNVRQPSSSVGKPVVDLSRKKSVPPRNSGSYNYLDVAQSQQTSVPTRSNLAGPKSVTRKKKKTFRPGFGRGLDDEAAAALQRGEINEEDVKQLIHRDSTGSNSSATKIPTQATDLAHLLPPVGGGSVLAGLTVHPTNDSADEKHQTELSTTSGGILSGLNIHKGPTTTTAEKSLSSNPSPPNFHMKERERKSKIRSSIKKAPAQPLTPEDILNKTLQDFHTASQAYCQSKLQQKDDEAQIVQRKTQLQQTLSQYEIDLQATEAQQAHASEMEDFEKAEILQRTISSIQHRITLTESDLRSVENELTAFLKAKDKVFGNQLKSTKGMMKALESFIEGQESEGRSRQQALQVFSSNEEEQIRFESERIEAELGHITSNLDHLSREKEDIESTIEEQCGTELEEQRKLITEKKVVEDEIRELEKQIAEKRVRIATMDENIESRQKDIDAVRQRYARQLKRIAERESGIQTSQKEVENDQQQLENQQQAFKTQLKAYENEVNAIQNRIARLKNEHKTAKILTSVLEKQSARYEAVHVHQKKQSIALASVQSAFAIADQSCATLEAQSIELEKSLTLHQNAIAQAISMIPPLENEKKNAAASRNFKEAARLSKDIKALEKEREKAEEAVELVEMEMADVKERLGQKEKDKEEKAKELERMEKQWDISTLELLWKQIRSLRKALQSWEDEEPTKESISCKESAIMLIQSELDFCSGQALVLESKYDLKDEVADDYEDESDASDNLDDETTASKIDVSVEVEDDKSPEVTIEEINEKITTLEKAIEEATENEDYEAAASFDEKIEILKAKKEELYQSVSKSKNETTQSTVLQNAQECEETILKKHVEEDGQMDHIEGNIEVDNMVRHIDVTEDKNKGLKVERGEEEEGDEEEEEGGDESMDWEELKSDLAVLEAKEKQLEEIVQAKTDADEVKEVETELQLIREKAQEIRSWLPTDDVLSIDLSLKSSNDDLSYPNETHNPDMQHEALNSPIGQEPSHSMFEGLSISTSDQLDEKFTIEEDEETLEQQADEHVENISSASLFGGLTLSSAGSNPVGEVGDDTSRTTDSTVQIADDSKLHDNEQLGDEIKSTEFETDTQQTKDTDNSQSQTSTITSNMFEGMSLASNVPLQSENSE